MARLLGIGAAAALTVLFTGTAQADQTIKDERSGMQVTIPDACKVEEGEKWVAFAAEDESIEIYMWVHPSDNWDDLKGELKWLYDELDKLLDDPEWNQDKPEETEINGMKAWYMNGKATYGEERIDWEVCVIDGKEPVLVLAVCTEGTFEGEVKEAYRKVVASVKPIEEE
jgi:hypothetical protein